MYRLSLCRCLRMCLLALYVLRMHVSNDMLCKKVHGWEEETMSSYTDNQGYTRSYDPGNPCSDKKGYIYQHRQKMTEKLNKENPDHPALDALGCLRPKWVVHHDDEDKGNNEDENLKLKKGNGHKSHHFTINNPHPTERDERGRFINDKT